LDIGCPSTWPRRSHIAYHYERKWGGVTLLFTTIHTLRSFGYKSTSIMSQGSPSQLFTSFELQPTIMSHTIVKGAQGGSTQGAVAPNRREIRDLIKDKEQFSLYIQALSKPPFRPYRSIMSPLTSTQESCFRRLRAIRCLILVLAEYTEGLSCRGRVPAATAPSKDQDGPDTVLTEMCFSRLGTGPMWPFMRLVPFYKILRTR
jgi:hypothetical protein